jgi:hypothetical protein
MSYRDAVTLAEWYIVECRKTVWISQGSRDRIRCRNSTKVANEGKDSIADRRKGGVICFMLPNKPIWVWKDGQRTLL